MKFLRKLSTMKLMALVMAPCFFAAFWLYGSGRAVMFENNPTFAALRIPVAILFTIILILAAIAGFTRGDQKLGGQ